MVRLSTRSKFFSYFRARCKSKNRKKERKRKKKRIEIDSWLDRVECVSVQVTRNRTVSKIDKSNLDENGWFTREERWIEEDRRAAIGPRYR